MNAISPITGKPIADAMYALVTQLNAEQTARCHEIATRRNAEKLEYSGEALLIRSIVRDAEHLNDAQRLGVILHLAREYSMFDSFDVIEDGIYKTASAIMNNDDEAAVARYVNRGKADVAAALEGGGRG